MISITILATVLAIAVACDLSSRRVPNGLTIPGAIAGVAASLLPEGIGIGASTGGLALGFCLLLPFYLLRILGAGDVKLMAAAGSLLGPAAIFAAVFYAFAAGGILTLAAACRARALGQVLANLRLFAYASGARLAAGSAPSLHDLPLTQVRAPYALAIAAGVAIQVLLQLARGTA